MYTVHVYCTCILYMYTVHVYDIHVSESFLTPKSLQQDKDESSAVEEGRTRANTGASTYVST